MNQLNHKMVKEFYKYNKEVQNKKTYEINIKRKIFKHSRRFVKYNFFDFKFQLWILKPKHLYTMMYILLYRK